MKLDVVCCYYKQFICTPYVMLGLALNRDHINRFILVNDEPWFSWERQIIEESLDRLGIESRLLDHPHRGFGVARSMNQGIGAAETPYVYMMSYDQILNPEVLLTIGRHARPGVLAVGAVHHLAETPGVLSLADAARSDFKVSYQHNPDVRTMEAQGQPWLYVSNAHTLIHRDSHYEIGGFDERFDQYGAEDLEYGARWQGRLGPGNIKWAGTYSVQFPGDRESRDVAPENQELLEATLTKYELKRLV